MAKLLLLVDDLDHTSDAAETVTFTVRGKSYEIDLSAAHVAEFDAALHPWITHARKAGKAPPTVRQKADRAAPEASNTPTRATASGSKAGGSGLPDGWTTPAGAPRATDQQYRTMRHEARDWAAEHGRLVNRSRRLAGQVVRDWCAERGFDPAGHVFDQWCSERAGGAPNTNGAGGSRSPDAGGGPAGNGRRPTTAATP